MVCLSSGQSIGLTSKASRAASAARAMPEQFATTRTGANGENVEVTKTIWLPPRDSNPDMLIQSPKTDADNKANQAVRLADSGKVRQNPQPPRNKNPRDGIDFGE
jgi:hypothetical protein